MRLNNVSLTQTNKAVATHYNKQVKSDVLIPNVEEKFFLHVTVLKKSVYHAQMWEQGFISEGPLSYIYIYIYIYIYKSIILNYVVSSSKQRTQKKKCSRDLCSAYPI